MGSDRWHGTAGPQIPTDRSPCQNLGLSAIVLLFDEIKELFEDSAQPLDCNKVTMSLQSNELKQGYHPTHRENQVLEEASQDLASFID